MKTYLVTGCAGFIGSNFVHYMLEKYQDIRLVNLDKLTYAGNLENLEDIKDDARHIFVKGDICDKALVTDLIANLTRITSSTLLPKATLTAASATRKFLLSPMFWVPSICCSAARMPGTMPTPRPGRKAKVPAGFHR